MKQVIIMIICILILLGGGIGEIKYLDKSSVYILSEIDYVENAINNSNFDEAGKQINITFDNWTKIKNLWNVFIIHEEIDDIDEAIIELKEYIKFENEEECFVAIEKIKRDLEHTVKRQKVLIDNIL